MHTRCSTRRYPPGIGDRGAPPCVKSASETARLETSGLGGGGTGQGRTARVERRSFRTPPLRQRSPPRLSASRSAAEKAAQSRGRGAAGTAWRQCTRLRGSAGPLIAGVRLGMWRSVVFAATSLPNLGIPGGRTRLPARATRCAPGVTRRFSAGRTIAARCVALRGGYSRDTRRRRGRNGARRCTLESWRRGPSRRRVAGRRRWATRSSSRWTKAGPRTRTRRS